MAASKRILCFGDSNTWGFVPVPKPPSTRYPAAQRWPHVMRQALGGEVEVIEEGLSARTTDVADPELPQLAGAGLDGSAYLPACLASHLPLDAVAIMLGTNDLKPRFGRTAVRIALGAKRLLDIVRTLDGGVGSTYPNPRALLICPPPLGTLSPDFVEMFAGGEALSRQLPEAYAAIARAAGAGFLDAGTVIATDGVDGVHFSAEMQRRLGLAVAEALRPLLA
jgi:lysophospholipase L1-like esterase